MAQIERRLGALRLGGAPRAWRDRAARAPRGRRIGRRRRRAADARRSAAQSRRARGGGGRVRGRAGPPRARARGGRRAARPRPRRPRRDRVPARPERGGAGARRCGPRARPTGPRRGARRDRPARLALATLHELEGDFPAARSRDGAGGRRPRPSPRSRPSEERRGPGGARRAHRLPRRARPSPRAVRAGHRERCDAARRPPRSRRAGAGQALAALSQPGEVRRRRPRARGGARDLRERRALTRRRRASECSATRCSRRGGRRSRRALRARHERFRARLGEDQSTFVALGNLGTARVAQGDPEGAREPLGRAIAGLEKAGASRPTTCDSPCSRSARPSGASAGRKSLSLTIGARWRSPRPASAPTTPGRPTPGGRSRWTSPRSAGRRRSARSTGRSRSGAPPTRRIRVSPNGCSTTQRSPSAPATARAPLRADARRWPSRSRRSAPTTRRPRRLAGCSASDVRRLSSLLPGVRSRQVGGGTTMTTREPWSGRLASTRVRAAVTFGCLALLGAGAATATEDFPKTLTGREARDYPVSKAVVEAAKLLRAGKLAEVKQSSVKEVRDEWTALSAAERKEEAERAQSGRRIRRPLRPISSASGSSRSTARRRRCASRRRTAPTSRRWPSSRSKRGSGRSPAGR